MTKDISLYLAGIEAGLHRLNRDALLHSLKKGLAAESVRSALATVGLSSTLELEALYLWRNGTSVTGMVLDDIHLFPGFYMLSIEDAITNYRAFVTDSRWQNGWLPIFANGGGDFYVLDLGAHSPGQVRHFRIDESEHPVEFTSLKAMLLTLVAAFERAIFFVDGRYLEMQDLAFAELAAELNPDADWWHS